VVYTLVFIYLYKDKDINRLTQNLPAINFQSQLRVSAYVKPSSDFVQIGYTKHLLSIKTDGLRLFRDRIAVIVFVILSHKYTVLLQCWDS